MMVIDVIIVYEMLRCYARSLLMLSGGGVLCLLRSRRYAMPPELLPRHFHYAISLLIRYAMPLDALAVISLYPLF